MINYTTVPVSFECLQDIPVYECTIIYLTSALSMHIYIVALLV